ncbi:magnesium-protoporphyrin IX methyltransferase [Tanacetum coccineum]
MSRSLEIMQQVFVLPLSICTERSSKQVLICVIVPSMFSCTLTSVCVFSGFLNGWCTETHYNRGLMAGMSYRCREITTALDAAGNTTAAIRKLGAVYGGTYMLNKPECNDSLQTGVGTQLTYIDSHEKQYAIMQKKNYRAKKVYQCQNLKIGELFPRPSKATRSYLHSEADIEQA